MNEPLLTVRRDIEKPPGGWKYTVPETGVVILGDFFSEMWPKIVRHYEANSLPVPDRELVEDRACRESPGGRCGPRRPKPVAGILPHLTLGLVERFIKTVWQSLKDRDFVSREEAERRAAVCAGCPLATGGIGGCKSCFDLIRKTREFVQASPIQFEKDKDVCGACGCYLPAKVLLANRTLDRAEGQEKPRYWDKCWRLEK